jgi:hypothetical protein
MYRSVVAPRMHLMKRTCWAISHCFIALDGSFCSGEREEAEAHIDPPFDRTVILLHNIVDMSDIKSLDKTATHPLTPPPCGKVLFLQSPDEPRTESRACHSPDVTV